MAIISTEGMSLLIGVTFDVAKPVTAIANGENPVADCAGHDFQNGDELLVISPWEGLSSTIVRAVNVAAGKVGLSGVDTSNTGFFAPGGGAGSTLAKITKWVEIPQVTKYEPSGGDPVYKSRKFLKRRNAMTYPTGAFEPTKIPVTMMYDPNDANYKELLKKSRATAKVAYKQLLSNGSATYAYGWFVIKETPVPDDGDLITTGTFSAEGLITSF